MYAAYEFSLPDNKMLEYFYESNGDYFGIYILAFDGLCGESYNTFK